MTSADASSAIETIQTPRWTAAQHVGVVAIGRNEGERLQRCLRSVVGRAAAVLYVDSGSTDGSVAFARSLGVEVVELTTSLPFTAARARNAGIERLLTQQPDLPFIQVIDGDCEVIDSWFEAALRTFEQSDMIAVVCGRRREREPQASSYNRLIDLEWDTPIGEAKACGGDALIIASAFRAVHGYNAAIIAGEEPEMCLRMRRLGWTIQRIDHEMTLHDANVQRFSQWWWRVVRNGHAVAEGHARHGSSPDHYRVREVRSIIEWAVLLPAAALAFAWWTWGMSLALLAGYGLLWKRVYAHERRRGRSNAEATLVARSTVIGKFAELLGLMRYWTNRLAGRKATIIEYKTNATAPRVARA